MVTHVAAVQSGRAPTRLSKMSAPDEDTFAEGGGEMEEMDEAGSDDDEGVEMEEEGAGGEEGERRVYVPGIEPLRPGEELEMDRSAYRMYHECQTGKTRHCCHPCLSAPSLPAGLNSALCVLMLLFLLLLLLFVFRGSVSQLRRPERRRWRRQGAVPSVNAALCGHTGGHSPEQQVGADPPKNTHLVNMSKTKGH